MVTTECSRTSAVETNCTGMIGNDDRFFLYRYDVVLYFLRKICTPPPTPGRAGSPKIRKLARPYATVSNTRHLTEASFRTLHTYCLDNSNRQNNGTSIEKIIRSILYQEAGHCRDWS